MYYFAYSLNLNKKQMLERCPDSKARFTAVLPNYKLIFVGWSRQWRGGTANIRALRGSRVPGGIYEISEQCLAKMDKFEGYPNDNTRLNVTVFTENEPIQAVTYLKTGHLEETPPSPQYIALLQQDYRDWGIV